MFPSFDNYLKEKMKRLLFKPFRYWCAFTLGIIDEHGNKLREPETAEERRRYNTFDELIRKIIVLFIKYTANAQGLLRFKMFKEFLEDGFLNVLNESKTEQSLVEAEYWIRCYLEDKFYDNDTNG